MIENIWLQLTLLLTIAVASHFLVNRFRQPTVMGEVIVGIIIGPTLVGYLFPTIIFNAELVTTFSQLGAILLLFIVGLESNFKQIYSIKSIMIALGGVILPLLGGLLLAFLFGYNFIEAIFIGVILVSTSVGVTAATLLEYGAMETQTAKQIIGAAVVDDIIGMVTLAVVQSTASETFMVWQIFIIVISAVAFLAIALLLSSWISRVIENVEIASLRRGVKYSGFTLALAIAFLYSFIAQQLGISAIVGSFIAGTTFSRIVYHEEFKTGSRMLSAIFTPIFFISLGILVNLRELNLSVIIFGIALIIIAIATKIVGSGLIAKLFHYSSRDSLIIGIGMIPRGEVAMIIAVYGITSGIIQIPLYSVAVLTALITTIVTPPLISHFYKKN